MDAKCRSCGAPIQVFGDNPDLVCEACEQVRCKCGAMEFTYRTDSGCTSVTCKQCGALVEVDFTEQPMTSFEGVQHG